ncbi:hypothetical protein SISNIDRAFT_465779 [Sistotremastrum niveocremeum HHB9708]|uniref:HAT C-terminal dimerisation domain-containing protein n=1 Tax=Sistotremastrum niveocremeum HHB9708 TaxID=1314777 RepID=A0A164UW47_9AGAM|nr:hypothetical protein SISNIDRAFT_465779 [Sistotremastrum niveocremeum HHB9708]
MSYYILSQNPIVRFLTLSADNASNNGTLMKEIARQLAPVYEERIQRLKEANNNNGSDPFDFGIDFDEDEPVDPVDPDKFTIRCLPHIIHLAVVDFLTTIKIRAISKLVRSSPPRYGLFKAALRNLEEGRKRKAKEKKEEYKVWIIDAVCQDADHPYFAQHQLDKAEWNLAQVLCGWLAMFQRASFFMSITSKPTLSSSMNAFVSLVDFLDNIKQTTTALANPSLLAGIATCREKLLKCFDRASSETQYYYFATHPNFKDALFKSGKNEEIFCEDWVRGCHEFFVKTYNTEYSAGATQSRQEVNNDARELDEVEQLMESRFADDEPMVQEEEDEIKTYLRESRAKKVHPLEWYVTISAMNYSNIHLGSSVSVERLFSIGRDLVSLRRASLSQSTIRETMVTRSMILLQKRMGSAGERGRKWKRGDK